MVSDEVCLLLGAWNPITFTTRVRTPDRTGVRSLADDTTNTTNSKGVRSDKYPGCECAGASTWRAPAAVRVPQAGSGGKTGDVMARQGRVGHRLPLAENKSRGPSLLPQFPPPPNTYPRPETHYNTPAPPMDSNPSPPIPHISSHQ